jgi:SWI/SNF-related matrix-associated actin-dependent regulator of chromatin subfamily D
MDPAAHLAELQARHERSLSAAKRPTDQTLPGGVEDNIVGDGVAQYKRMRDVERRLDAITMRKMMGIEQEVEMEEEIGPVNPLMEVTRRQYRTMRIWITNTAENQPWQGTTSLDENAFDFNTGADPRYRVKIVGKIIDSEKSDAKGNGHASAGVDLDDEALFDDLDSDSDEDAMDAEHEKGVQLETNGTSTADKSHPEAQIAKILERLESKNPPMKLSHCFERINVDYDRSQTLQTDTSNLVEWNRPENWNVANPPPGADFDTLEFERKSDENLHCTIHLHRQSHGLFKLSPLLADLLQMKEASRAEVIQALWQYIHLSRLPQEEDKGLVQCDEALKTVSTCPTLSIPTS